MKKIISAIVVSFLLVSPVLADSNVTATADAGSAVSPSGLTVVPTGVDQTFNINAQSGFTLSDVSVDGVSQGAVSSVDFTGVDLDPILHTIDVSSQIIAPTGGSAPWCSSPTAPGYNVSLPGGGCGDTRMFVPFGHALDASFGGAADTGNCQFQQGCEVSKQ